MIATLYRLISLGLLILLTLSACSGVAPLVVQGQMLPGDSEPTQPAIADSPPLAVAPPTSTTLPKPTNPPAATPISSKIPAHPQGCSPASLPQSVLVYTWSERQQENSLFPLDAITGQPLCKFEPLSLGKQFAHAFSTGGDMLVITVSEHEDGRDHTLRWIDLKSWQMHESKIKFEKYVISIEVSPDGQKLAISAASPQLNSYQIIIVDLASQSVQAEMTLSFLPRLLKFTADGSTLVVYGSADSPNNQETSDARVMLLDSSTLDSRWETTLSGVMHGLIPDKEKSNSPEGFETWEPAVIYASDQGKLYIVHADADRLTTVDLNTRTTLSAEIIPATSWIERLLALTAGVARAKTLDGFFKTGVLSPDGSRLYILGHTADSYQDKNGNWQINETPYGLKVIDIATGAEVAHLDTQANELEFSEDGQNLLLRSWTGSGWTEVLDAKTLEEKIHVEKRQLYTGRRLDGQPVVLATTYHQNGQTTLAIVDPGSFEVINQGWTTLWASWLVER